MGKQRRKPFKPPTVQQVRNHLQRNQPRDPSKWALWGPLLLMVIAFVIAAMWNTAAAWALPWLVVIGTVVFMSMRVRRFRQLDEQVHRVQELGLRRNASQSLRLAWRLLPQVNELPMLHGRIVAFIAHNLDMLKCYDQALVAYDYLIKRLPHDHPGAVPIKIHRTMALLANDQLADADDALRNLRNVADMFAHSVVGAAYHMAKLLQLVRTNHFEDAVSMADNLVEQLRPLGVDAAYGHALMALSCQKLYDLKQQGDVGEGLRWWSRATLLIPPGGRVERYPELRDIAAEPGYVDASVRSAFPGEYA